jgi:hypothetical protein
MVLCDPFAINVIGKSIIKVLLHLTTTEVLPRVCMCVDIWLQMCYPYVPYGRNFYRPEGEGRKKRKMY